MNDTTLSNFGFTPRYIEVVHTAQRQFFSLITPWHPKAMQTNRGAHQSPQWNKRAVFEMYCLFYFWADTFPINNSFYIPKTENLSLSERSAKNANYPLHQSLWNRGNLSAPQIHRVNLNVCALQPHLEETCISNSNPSLWGVHYVQL